MRIVGVLLLLLAAGALVARYVPATNRALLVMAALSPYLMLGAPLGALAFALSRHWTLVSVAAVLTVAVLAVQLPWYIGSPDPDTGTTLRFVSANLLLGEAEPAAIAALAAEHADILAVQELTPELAAALSPALARDFPHSALRPRERAAGVGLWSRYPIITSGSDESFSRGLIYARVQVPDTDFATTVVSTHMPPPRSAFDSWRSDIARLGPALHELPPDGPVVVGGDLNATPDVREFRQLLRDGYRDGAAQAGAGLTRTHPSNVIIPPLLAVDHIMTRNASVTSLRTVEVAGSDHLALAATVVLH
ncbi:endonuclease/exonuclease/phosphatase family protein [Mycolicibacterium frederiksbergense]|uniref:Endonuclease/exonuclease/phosphatase family protein n=1 Tax=Mycolicibacterium frederiksbergense TaxID=117567 RepID=A0A6H0S3X6_9MYCO|nr:endonuclease/exonuclease/phosphatase family protein [Mycolicibacterium frederiksbergense]QIV81149.1 endonuclease/exonuclease/phosphatase family protein [Mycolicibacterium frederiksbergense]